MSHRKKVNERATKRLSVTPAAFERFRSFCQGLDAEYSEAIDILVSSALKSETDPFLAGFRIRNERILKERKTRKSITA